MPFRDTIPYHHLPPTPSMIQAKYEHWRSPGLAAKVPILLDGTEILG